MSLRSWLLLTITSVLAGTAVLGGVLIFWHAVRKVENEMQAAMTLGQRIARNAVDDAEEIVNPRRRLDLLIADFDGDHHLRAFLIDPTNKVSAVSHLHGPVRPIPRWIHESLAGKPEMVELELPPVFKPFGKVFLETDPRNEIGEVWNDLKLYAAILATFCGLVLCAIFLTLGRALRPLEELTSAFPRVGLGDYRPRVGVSGPSEVVRLATGFNQMAERLSDIEARNSHLREQLETVQEEERADLARNLHDEVSPLLFSVDVDATAIRELAATGSRERVEERAEAIQDAVARLKRNVKAILGQLRPAGIQHIGLPAAVKDLVSFLKERHPAVEFVVDVRGQTWGAGLDRTIHGIVRESLSNALKHGAPGRIEVRVVESQGAVLIEIVDDGGGFSRPASAGGFGILVMQERAAILGGTLSARNSSDGKGVTVSARLPISAPERWAPGGTGMAADSERRVVVA